MSLLRGLMPFAKAGTKTALRLAKSDVGKSVIKSVKKSGKRAIKQAAIRALEGKGDVKEGAKRDLQAAKRDIARVLKKKSGSSRDVGPVAATQQQRKRGRPVGAPGQEVTPPTFAPGKRPRLRKAGAGGLSLI